MFTSNTSFDSHWTPGPLDDLGLTDHHCHGVLRSGLSRAEFEDLSTESSWPAPPHTTVFDSQLGISIRRLCSQLLDLEAHSTAEEYLLRRNELGADVVNGRMLSSTNISTFLVETGYRGGEITTPEETAALASAALTSSIPAASAHEVVRLESIAEQVIAADPIAQNFEENFSRALRIASAGAVGVKSIIAYRYGFDFNPARPSAAQLRSAVSSWLARHEITGGELRVDDPTILRHLLWSAIDLGKPIQLHTGYGDPDVDLHRCNPLLLSEWLRATRESNVPILLLHCYPYQREAGYLAQVFPHVYADVGLAVNYTGSRSETVIAELLELAPFHKVLFSSDAFGLSELYFLGSHLFRRGLNRFLEKQIREGDWSAADAEHVASLIAAGNAGRVYGVTS